MAAIDRDALLEDVKFWLPADNPLDDTIILKVNEYVIANVMTLHAETDPENESLYEPEIKCKCLEANARKIMSSQAVGEGASRVKREKVRNHEKEYFDSTVSNRTNWNDYIKSDLPYICPLFGYNVPGIVGAYVNVADTIYVPSLDCDDEDELSL